MAFPTLSIEPTVTLSEKPATEAADLKNKTDAGYVISRQRFTRVPITYVCQYGPMTTADHDLLVTHIALVGATGNFDWTHPLTSATHDVRYVKRPALTYRGIHWWMSCEMEEV